MKSIQLKNRKGEVVAVTYVDDEDYDRLSIHVWHRSAPGYAVRFTSRKSPPRKCVLMHREIMRPSDRDEVDHKNLDKLDNQKENLRVVPKYGNRQNVGSNKHTSSKHRGVSWVRQRNKWNAYCTVDGVRKNLGYFANEDDAAKAASEYRKRNMKYANE